MSLDVHNHQAIVGDDGDSAIGIISPIPLPYSARSEAVLRSMISTEPIRKSGSAATTESFSGVKTRKSTLLERAPGRTVRHSPIAEPPLIKIPSGVSNHQVMIRGCNSPLRFRKSARIQPITWCTLMALTEPFLMAWCLENSAEIVDPILSQAGANNQPQACLASHHDHSPVRHTSPSVPRGDATSHSVRNPWGY